METNKAVSWVDAHGEQLIDIANKIWGYAEIALNEYKSAELLVSILKENGFTVKTGLAEMPTAFRASWGKGAPVIGFLAEYDALPGLSQKAKVEHDPVIEGGPGHGCGHNLLGAAAVGAALGLKHEMEAEGLAGTVVVYGCPAEEIMTGKIFMAKAGLFRELDAALTWHPGMTNVVFEQTLLAMNSVKFGFYGKTAHAAAAPEQGKSALGAVELMNVGVNYLREHITSDVRIHYTITNGGGEPNVVPGYAQSWYYIRAPKRESVDEVYRRVVKVAEGAALMTDTKLEVSFQSGCYHPLENCTLNALLYDCLSELKPPEWSSEEMAYAKKITETFSPGQKTMQLSIFGDIALADEYLHKDVLGLKGKSKLLPASTDVADVSWITPTVQIMTACQPLGTAGHTWQSVAVSGMSIGHKGMLYAARVLALAGSRLMKEKGVLKKARDEFNEKTNGKEYVCVVPDGVKPGQGI